MTAADDYLGRVQAVVWDAAGWVSSEGLGRVQHLVDHGEPAEGLCSLAWIIVNEQTMVPASIVRAIREYSADLVPSEHLPDELDAHAFEDGASCD